MAYRFGPQLLTGAYHFGVGGLGVLGSEVPSTGTHGAGYLYNDITLPGEAGDEFYGLITSFPVGLSTFFAYEDSSFTATGPDGSYSFTYTGYKNGTSYGTQTVTITLGAAALVVQDATHAHAADNLALSGTGTAALTIADAAHAHAPDALVLSTLSALAVQDAAHAHAADGITFTVGGTSLTAADAIHAHAADALAFTLDSWLAVADARHVHRVDNVVLTLPSTGAMYAGPARTARGLARATLRGHVREPIRGYRPS